MSYSLAPSEFDNSTGGFGKYDAEIVNAGVAHRDKGEQIVFVCKPTNEKMRIQAVSLSMGSGDFKLGGTEEILSFGEGEKQWGMTIYSEIISGPKIKTISNAGLFLNALKHLGFEVVTGNIRLYIGLKLTLEEVAINEAIKRFNETHPKSKAVPARTGDFGDKTITLPIELLEVPKVKVTLQEALLVEIEAKQMDEDKVVLWYQQTGYCIENDSAPVVMMLDHLQQSGLITVDAVGVYVTKK